MAAWPNPGPARMRDLLVIGIMLAGAGYALHRPWVGVLFWTWVSIMNPHRYSYEASNLPLLAMVAVCTLIGVLASRDKRSPFMGSPPVWLAVFMVWMSITTLFAFEPEKSYNLWNKVMKIDLMVLVTLMVLRTRFHIMLFAWVATFSVAFYGIKGGLFTIATGGSYRVWGPTASYIEGNNELALALVMTIPLIRFLQMRVTDRRLFHALTAAMVLCAASALGSHSRGALLAIVAMGLMLWWRGRAKLAGAFLMLLVAIGLLAFMPENWFDRMNTISTYEQDASAMGRINAWWMCYNLAKDNLFGGGFSIYTAQLFARYAPDPLDIHAAHSVYFQVLGEHGFVGLFIFLGIGFATWRTAGWLRKHATDGPTRWCGDLGGMIQVSMAGFAIGGAFLSLAYFDFIYDVMIMVVLAKRWVQERLWEKEAQPSAEQSLGQRVSELLGLNREPSLASGRPA